MNQAATAADLDKVMHSIIQRIATGPELSKDISREEARLGMHAILEGAVDPVRAGIFFIALRMKRETMDEFEGILDAILDATGRVTAEVDEVVDIADPYDGYNRCLPAAPFLAPLLAGLAGADPERAWAWRRLPLVGPVGCAGDRETFALGRCGAGGVEMLVVQDSASQRSLGEADLLIRRRPGASGAAAGEPVECLSF